MLSKGEAHARFPAIRWGHNGSEPFCPRCGGLEPYAYATPRIRKCKGRGHQFSITSGTIFASRKLSVRNYLATICLFVNVVTGVSALQLGLELGIQYRRYQHDKLLCR